MMAEHLDTAVILLGIILNLSAIYRMGTRQENRFTKLETQVDLIMRNMVLTGKVERRQK